MKDLTLEDWETDYYREKQFLYEEKRRVEAEWMEWETTYRKPAIINVYLPIKQLEEDETTSDTFPF
jgi:hypothetical protein